MSPEAQRIAIAEACGWRHIKNANTMAMDGIWVGYPPKMQIVGRPDNLPNYLNDLNAMHEAVMSRKDEPGFMGRYNVQLAMACVVSGRDVRTKAEDFAIHNATTAQRAEAFIKALNLWDDSK